VTAYGSSAAEQTMHDVERMADAIRSAAKAHSLDPSIVAGIISRETFALDEYCQPPPHGRDGDDGHGHGPMQVDDRSFPDWCSDWDNGRLSVTDGILKGCEILRSKFDEVARLIPGLPSNQNIRAAVAAYNCGTVGVRRALSQGLDVDARTTDANYSADVLERAKVFAPLFVHPDDEIESATQQSQPQSEQATPNDGDTD